MSATTCRCGASKDPGYVVCLACWRLVPIALKRALWQALQNRRRVRKERVPFEHRKAVRAVLEFLRDQEKSTP